MRPPSPFTWPSWPPNSAGRGTRSPCTPAASLQEREELVRQGLPRPRISVVPTGVDVGTFTDRGPSYPRGDRPRLLMLSGPGEHTGCLTAVQALTRVPAAELVIAGGPVPD